MIDLNTPLFGGDGEDENTQGQESSPCGGCSGCGDDDQGGCC